MPVKHFAIILVAAVFCVPLSDARSFASEPVDIPLFRAADESSLVVGSVTKEDGLSPMAESMGPGGTRWYLVRTKNGSVGWIKGGDNEESKKLEKFFKSLPDESGFGVAVALPEAPSGSLPRGTIVVPVQARGSSVIVAATLNRALTAYLIVDTGATITIVSQRIASELGLRTVTYGTFAGVGGVIRRPMAQLRSLKVGEAEIQNLVVAVHDFHPNPQIEGLLGLDFLRRFHVSLDSRKQQLVLSPR